MRHTVELGSQTRPGGPGQLGLCQPATLETRSEQEPE